MNDRHDKELQHASAPAEERAGADERNQGNGRIAEEAPARHETSGEPQSPPPSPPPPRGPKLWVILAALAAVLLIGGIMLWIGAAFSENVKAAAERVEAVLVGSGGGESAAAASAADDSFWTCGMHPWVMLPDPGDCPICHMALTPLDPGKLAGEIAIHPTMLQNIGVRTAPVVAGPLTREVRTVGTVAYDEAAVRVVNTRVSGWIEKLYVDQEGRAVRPGEPLFDLYSPELYSAQAEYLQTYRNRSQSGAAGAGMSLLKAARTRLEYFGISDQQIQELQRSGEARKTMTIHSPHRGVVVEKQAHEGMRIEPGTRVYRIADLSTVWVRTTLYEQQLPFVKVGQPAIMTLPYLPGEVFRGEVAYIYPYLKENTRQINVRLEFENRKGLLKPGMFAAVRLERTLDRRAVLAPRDAILGFGKREVAFVSTGGGRFEPREVDTGVETGDGMIEITDGLKPGERVVVNGQFLLDSESKMRAALAKMVEGDSAGERKPAVPDSDPAPDSDSAGSVGPPEVSAEARARVDRIFTSYLSIRERLAADRLDGVGRWLSRIREAAAWLSHSRASEAVRAGAGAAGEAAGFKPRSLEQVRERYQALSSALIDLARLAPPSDDAARSLHVVHCPMVEADWLQASTEPANPYMGSRMLRCGAIERTIKQPRTDRTGGADEQGERGGRRGRA